MEVLKNPIYAQINLNPTSAFEGRAQEPPSTHLTNYLFSIFPSAPQAADVATNNYSR